jgi:hypothetical protein
VLLCPCCILAAAFALLVKTKTRQQTFSISWRHWIWNASVAAVVVKWDMTHDHLKNKWLTTEQMLPSFYGKTIRHDRFLCTLRFLHFWNSNNALDNNGLNYDIFLTSWMMNTEKITPFQVEDIFKNGISKGPTFQNKTVQIM